MCSHLWFPGATYAYRAAKPVTVLWALRGLGEIAQAECSLHLDASWASWFVTKAGKSCVPALTLLLLVVLFCGFVLCSFFFLLETGIGMLCRIPIGLWKQNRRMVEVEGDLWKLFSSVPLLRAEWSGTDCSDPCSVGSGSFRSTSWLKSMEQFSA